MRDEYSMEALDLLRQGRLKMRNGRYRAIREAYGLTQQEVADQIGVGQASIARYENGLAHPSRAIAARYIALMDDLSRRIADHAGDES